MSTVFEVEKNKEKIRELEEEIKKPNFWEDKEKARKISQESVDLKEKINEFEELKKELKVLKELIKEEGIEKEVAEFEDKLKEKEFKIFLSGKYDKNSAILLILAGAGGKDSQDWAAMLLRMYERFSRRKGFKTKILDQSFGEAGGPEGRIGVKSVVLKIEGNYVFGFLKKESGVHRLVRISPFSSQSLRHTSFALVEVLPEIPKTEEIKIRPEDLKLETFRSSGPGGQNVQKRETAVRIIYLPTNISASCQSERWQGKNREEAMKILIAKLQALKEREREKELKKIKSEIPSASWGNQIRSYVLHPYKLVKDLRTNMETSLVEKVLDGDIDEFIKAEIGYD